MLLALGAVHTRQFQAKRSVVQHGHVRHQRERLEHHADVFAAQRTQLGVGVQVDVLPVDHDAPGGGFDQAVQQAHEGGFARTRQAHDDEDFARMDVQVRVEHGDGMACLGQDVLFGYALPDKVQSSFGCFAENLEDMIDGDFFCHAPGSFFKRVEQAPPGGDCCGPKPAGRGWCTKSNGRENAPAAKGLLRPPDRR